MLAFNWWTKYLSQGLTYLQEVITYIINGNSNCYYQYFTWNLENWENKEAEFVNLVSTAQSIETSVVDILVHDKYKLWSIGWNFSTILKKYL